MGGQRRVAKHVVEAFYQNMSKDSKDGDVMDCTKAAWALALDHTTRAVQTKVPLEQRMAFIHIGVVLAVLLILHDFTSSSYQYILFRLHRTLSCKNHHLALFCYLVFAFAFN